MKTAEDEEFDAIAERQKLAFNESANFEPIKKPWVELTEVEMQWIYDNCRTPSGMIEMTEAMVRGKNT